MTTTSIKAYNAKRATRYPDIIKVAGYGSYRHMLKNIINGLKYNDIPANPAITDLGCGTGNLTKKILNTFPGAEIICVDGSRSMLAQARCNLPTGKITFKLADLTSPSFIDALPGSDAVISSAAIHHLTTGQKNLLFRKIYSRLKPQGIIMIGDILKGDNNELTKLYEKFWIDHIAEGIRRYSAKKPDKNNILQQHRISQMNEKDRPDTLGRQLLLLKNAGFTNVDCYWKLFGFAVFGGRKR